MANIYRTITCENCGNHEFIKKGKSKDGLKMILRCKNCGKTTRVDFDIDTDLPLSELQFTPDNSEKVMNDVIEEELTSTSVEEECCDVLEETTTSETTETYVTLFDEDGKKIDIENFNKEQLINFANQMNLSIVCVDEKKQLYRIEPKVNHTKG